MSFLAVVSYFCARRALAHCLFMFSCVVVWCFIAFTAVISWYVCIFSVFLGAFLATSVGAMISMLWLAVVSCFSARRACPLFVYV